MSGYRTWSRGILRYVCSHRMHIKAGFARAVISILNPHSRRQRDEAIALLYRGGMRRIRGRARQDNEIPVSR